MIEHWQQRLATAVSPLGDGVRTLRVNNFRHVDDGQSRPRRTAAVLVPILDLPEPEILLTRRAEHLSQHAGQVSFPGGGMEHDDDSAVITALREAEEEIGLRPDAVTPLGFLDRFDTVSDYRVLPVVGLVQPSRQWNIDTREVAEVFTLPLEIALDRTRYHEQVAEQDGKTFVFHRIEWQGHVVWGLTAAMLLNLLKRMEQI